VWWKGKRGAGVSAAIVGPVGRDLNGRSWGEVVDVWLAAACDSPSTRRVYAWALRRAFAVMGATTIDEVTPYDLAAFREDVMSSSLAPATKRGQIGALRSFLRWARAFGVCTIGPEVVDVALRMPSTVTQAPYTILTEEEIGALIAVATRPRDRGMVMVMLGAGLRVSEVADLDVGDLVAGEPPYVVVRRGKGGHGRAVPVRAETMAALRVLAVGRPTETPLFRSAHGPPGRLHVPGLRERLAALGLLAGIVRPVTPHMLRHTYAVRALLHTGNVMAISKLLGHKQLSTTARYLDHLELPHLLESVPQLPGEVG
jgi:site-specific recombinase XerD